MTHIWCTHETVKPKFDREKAKDKTVEEIRKLWPRFEGVCPRCGQRLILYATYEHYAMGDW